jgi:hypothetical protein
MYYDGRTNFFEYELVTPKAAHKKSPKGLLNKRWAYINFPPHSCVRQPLLFEVAQ